MIELDERVGAEPKVVKQKKEEKKEEKKTLPGVSVDANGGLPEEDLEEAKKKLKENNVKID